MKFLIIQTAFIGDAILATAVLEKLHSFFPNDQVDYLIRKGNEQLFENHPFINNLLVWDKKKSKLKHQLEIISQIRNAKYDYVINCQRYFSSGLFSVLSGAKCTIGFDKNPLSSLFNKVVVHNFDGRHEVQRNQKLIESITDQYAAKPRLYPHSTFNIYSSLFITISPSSVWFTKQFPKHKWIEFIDKVPESTDIHLLGAFGDKKYNEEIIDLSKRKSGIYNKAGEFSLLESAALMKGALMNYVNDSAPMHLCSAVNAPVCAVYCSTIPEFGFGPLSDISHIIEVDKKLDCRPCGIHGHKACPKGHFKCAEDIEIDKLLILVIPKKISVDTSKVFYHQKFSKNASVFHIHSTHKGDDRDKNIEIAIFLADLGLEVKLLPNNIYPHELWLKIMPEGTKPYKHPDALINGEIFEFKTITSEKIETIDSEVRKAKNQSENLLFIRKSDISIPTFKNCITKRVLRTEGINQIWLIIDDIVLKNTKDGLLNGIDWIEIQRGTN